MHCSTLPQHAVTCNYSYMYCLTGSSSSHFLLPCWIAATYEIEAYNRDILGRPVVTSCISRSQRFIYRLQRDERPNCPELQSTVLFKEVAHASTYRTCRLGLELVTSHQVSGVSTKRRTSRELVYGCTVFPKLNGHALLTPACTF